MTYDTDASGRSRLSPALDPSELDRTDRILLGSCAAIWLVALGTGVAATVALVDLGRGHAESPGDAGTPWLLYTVIGISAVVIIGAVPLLLRARREALAEPPQAARPASPATEKLKPAGARAGLEAQSAYAAPRPLRSLEASEPGSAAVDLVWLRCAVVIACAIGVAMVAIGVATYLMAVDSNVAAWVFYVLTALVTLAMPVVPWFYLKELRALPDQQSA
ncbi:MULTISPECIES: DUF2561 family protein [unclassified Mycobacterium]|uniref:DUF2561 family protein n=1 Tax=unclassified Mycobacterium TaxID=2642494 RepID=UPI000740311F|nr:MULTISPECIES: DUF2561 family protein [unclassified Mycobacterium]KUH83925.1 hypothetical protein AU187_07640 [Mycobacterium sp. IS-1556]KUH88511.1 hypothetical protein AU185_15705 [Mycobacterium sp. GA-0227b]KUH89715.1 hypothetical protein AU186_04835 [Mycobacterium sp. GA-1999]